MLLMPFGLGGFVGCGSGTSAPPDNSGNNAGSEPECTSNSDCGDGAFCNGIEICSAGTCHVGNDPCDSDERCVESDDRCVVESPDPEPECERDSDCDDDRFCNGAEFCDDGECRDGDFPCEDMCSETDNVCVTDEPEPEPETEPEPDGPLPEGTFIGTRQCNAFYEVGSLSFDSQFSASVALSVGDDGRLVFDGEAFEEGATFESLTGSVYASYEITSVDETSNGVTIGGAYYEFWNCGDSCVYANDGFCDEIEFCDLGTDCGDCGPIEMIGQFSITFRGSGQTIEYTSIITAADLQDFVTASIQCDALLD